MKTLFEFLVKGNINNINNTKLSCDLFGTIQKLVSNNILDGTNKKNLYGNPVVSILCNGINSIAIKIWKNGIQFNENSELFKDNYEDIITDVLSRKYFRIVFKITANEANIETVEKWINEFSDNADKIDGGFKNTIVVRFNSTETLIAMLNNLSKLN